MFIREIYNKDINNFNYLNFFIWNKRANWLGVVKAFNGVNTWLYIIYCYLSNTDHQHYNYQFKHKVGYLSHSQYKFQSDTYLPTNYFPKLAFIYYISTQLFCKKFVTILNSSIQVRHRLIYLFLIFFLVTYSWFIYIR